MPTIKYIEPEEGYPGQAVTLIGENLRDNLQVMFGSSIAYNSKLLSPNAMRVIVPSRTTSAGLVDVSLACKENNRNFCKLSTPVSFRYSSPNELELNFSRLQDLIYRISKEPAKLSKEGTLKKTADILEKILQNSVFQQIGLQALAVESSDLASNNNALSLVNSSSTNSSTSSTGSNSSLNSSGSISSRMNINASLPSNLNNLISNTNMMMNNAMHNNQLGHHLNSTNAGSPVSNHSPNHLQLMSNNLTNNLSNSNSNSSTGTNSNNGTPTQMINSINHNAINHNSIKYENAYQNIQNNVTSASSVTNHMMNSARNTTHHHTSGSYISSQNMQSTPGIFNNINSFHLNPFALAQGVNQPYLTY